MKIRALVAAVAVATAVVTGTMSACSQHSADVFIYGGTIYTLSDETPQAEAVVVTGEEISFAGSRADAERYVGPDTRRIDLGGQVMIPGLVDAHAHLRSLGRYLARLKLERAQSPAGVREMVLATQRSTPPGRWIQGRGWDQNDWAVKRFPTWRDLEGTEANPVYLRRVDGHAAWVNKTALDMCGISSATPDPDGGRIVRDETGAPTGVLVDNAMDLVTDVIPDPTPEQIDDWMRAAVRHCNALGLVGMHDAGIDAEDLASLQRLHEGGELSLTVYCMLSTEDDDLEWTERQLALGPRELADSRVAVRAIKLYADGALGSRGAAMLAPYSDAPDQTGLMVDPPAKLERLTRLAAQNGFQVCTHAIGDRGNRVILDVYEKVLAETNPESNPRFRIEHAQIVSLEDIPRFQQLGVIPSMQPTHCTSDMYWAQDRVGEERIAGAYAWRRLLQDGNIIPCGSDFPVENADPLAGIYAAVTRQDANGWPEGGWQPQQRMTMEEAVRGFTAWAAYAAFDESQSGSIVPGKRADFTVLDRDPLQIAPAEILNTRVSMTIVRGAVVYERN
jgi:predicted amidohydrolase YtcJ